MDKRMNFGRGFDYQLKPCDFDKWVKFDSLPIEQACFVLLGFEPFQLEVTNAKSMPYFERRLPSWERPPGFDDALALLKNSIQNGNVQSEPSMIGQYFARQIKWPALISWAKSKRYAIPPELEGSIELVVLLTPVIGTATTEPIAAAQAATIVTPGPVVASSNAKPWLSVDPQDPAPMQPWYTPARYFARQFVIEKPTLLANRELLAGKVSTALFNAGFKKRGGKHRFDSGTVLKAFANVTFD